MAIKRIIGIDPGLAGGIAVLDADGGELIECVKMPSTPMDILAYLRGWSEDSDCYMESVGFGMPGQSSKATATFARHNGHLEMALMACAIPAVAISPARWQKALGLSGKKGESKQSHKNGIKAKMQMLYPNVKVTLALADALAIARYGYELRRRCL